MHTAEPRLILLDRLQKLADESLSDAQLNAYIDIDFRNSVIVSAGAGSGKTRLASFLISKARLRAADGNTRVVTMSRTAKMEVFERSVALDGKLACDAIHLPAMPLSNFQTLHAIAFKAEHNRLKGIYGDDYELNVVFKKEISEMFKKEIEVAEQTQGFSETSFHPISSMSFDFDEKDRTAVERAERDVISNMDKKSGSDLLYSLRSERLKLCEPVSNASFGHTAQIALNGIQKTMCGEIPGEGEIHTVLVDFDLMVLNLAESGVPIASAGDVLFVDEAQDLSHCQTKIIMNAVAAGAILIVLGDESQGIFGFSGAMTNTLCEIRSKATKLGVTVLDYKLYKNYRSTDSIVKCAEQFLPNDEREKRNGIVGNGKHNQAVELACCDDEPFEVARKLVAMLKDGIVPGDIAILRHKAFSHGDEFDNALRTEAEQVDLDKKLLNKSIFGVNVMTSHAMKVCAVLRVALGLENFAETPDDAIHLLKDFLRSCGGVKTTTTMALKAIEVVWDSACCSPADLFAGHHMKMKSEFAKLEREDNAKNPPKRQKPEGGSQKMKNFSTTIDAASVAIKDAERSVNSWAVGKSFCAVGQTKLSFKATKIPNVADLVRHLSKTIITKENEGETTWMISELERKLRGQKTKESLVDAVHSIIAEKISKETEGKLLFSTIHRYKGKERPIVFLMGCSAPFVKPSWPQRANLHSFHEARCTNKCGMDLECGCHRYQAGMARICKDMEVEKDRLLYVGATRAQERLYISTRSDAPPHRALMQMLPEIQTKRNTWTKKQL